MSCLPFAPNGKASDSQSTDEIVPEKLRNRDARSVDPGNVKERRKADARALRHAGAENWEVSCNAGDEAESAPLLWVVM